MNRTHLEAFRTPRAASDEEPNDTEKREAEREDTANHIRRLSDGEILQRYEG
jgi:hypothetical protein